MKSFLRFICLLMFLIAVSLPLTGQESKSTINVQGKDVSSLKHAWSAQWLTHPTASTVEYGVFLYRRSIDLVSTPDNFIIYVSADNRYKLYVNGIKLSTGPSRGDINNWRYETVDIAPYLKIGKNTLAAEVVNFGEFKHAAQLSFQTAFILQGHEDNIVDINTRPDGTWKIYENKAFDYIPTTSDSVGGYYAAGPNDILDASLYPWGWEEQDFDDSSWVIPRAATVEFAVGRGFLFGSTWYLTPRTIPFMREEQKRITKVVRTDNIKLDSHIFTGKAGITIPANSKVSILLDQTVHTVGYPELHFSKGKSSNIKISYAEALFYKEGHTRTAHGGWEKGHRNVFKNKEIRGYYDIIKPDGGMNRKFSPLAMRVYRFIQLDIITEDEPLIIDDFYGVYTVYPFVEQSSFVSDDKELTEIWDVAWRTLQNSSFETFLDPYYEQLQYVGDSRVEAMVAIYVANDDKLMRKAIKSFDDSRLPMGLTASRFPSYIVQVIPTYSLLWVDMINDYYMYRDDPEFLKQFLPGMSTVLDWFDRHIDSTGILGGLDWWNFTDWTAGFDNGIPPGADDGHSANVTLQYVFALQNAIPIYRHFGKDNIADRYEKIAKNLQEAVIKNCYDDKKKLIAERPEKDVFSQHTNIFALLTDTYDKDDSKRVMRDLLNDKELIQTSIYFKYYLTRALQKVGMADEYMNQLEPWKYMLSQGMTTFGETDKNPRSDCHGWSATPCFEYLHTIAGIQPGSPGFKTVIIEPAFGSLDKFIANFAHPKGQLIVNLKKKNNRVKGTIILPKGITGEYRHNDQIVKLKSGKNMI